MAFRDWWLRLRALVRPQRVEGDLRDELDFHVELETRKLQAQGLDAQTARQQALARFGSVALAADQCRDERRISVVTDVVADGRYALRQFRRRPATVLTMICVLALGLGVSATVYITISSFEAAPPAGVHPDASMVRIRGIDRGRFPGRAIGREFTYPEYRAYADQIDTFASVAAWTATDVSLDVGTDTPNLQSGAATFVTADYFPVLGLRPAVGTGLPTDAVDTGPPTLAAVISDAIWHRFYDRAPDVVGRTIKVNGVAVTIVGVAPRRFIGARTGASAVRVWMPLNARHVFRLPTPGDERSGGVIFGVVARLQPGVDPVHATTVVETIAARFDPSAAAGGRPSRDTDVVPLRAGNYFPPSGEEPGIAGRVMSLTTPLLVLLITCTAVSALLAGIALSRRREMAMRLAMGAHRGRLIRQLLTESGLLGLAAGALVLFIVWNLVTGLDATFFDMPLWMDWRVAAFTLGLAVLTGVGFGVSPALHATRLALSDVLKEADLMGTRSRLQATMVVAQIALTQPALVAMGGLLLNLHADLQRQPVSLHADHVLDLRFNTNPRYGVMDARREDALRRVRDRLAALPGVVGVIPQGATEGDVRIDDTTMARVDAAPPGYFRLMGPAIVRGRDFAAADDPADGPVIIGEGLARRLWGDGDPIGERLAGQFTVIGTVADDGDADVRVYVPEVSITGSFLVHTGGPAHTMVTDVRAVAQEEAPDVPVVSVRTRASIEAEARTSTRQGILAAGTAGGLALALAAIGLYSVTAFAVGQRVREIGIRAALGADRRRIVGLFLRRGLRLALTGVVVGLTLSGLIMQILAAAEGKPVPTGIYGVAMGVTLFVMTVAVLATWIPARRAALVDPLVALRRE